MHRNDSTQGAGLPVPATLPELARGEGNTFWVIPSEVTSALSGIAQAFGPGTPPAAGPSLTRPEAAVAEIDGAEPRPAELNGSGRAGTSG